MRKIKEFLYLILLSILKAAVRKKIKTVQPQIVGVSGSVGKTSFIHLLHEVVQADFVTRTTFQANSEAGLPLGILGLREKLKGFDFLSWLKVLCFVPAAAFSRAKDFNLLIAEMGIDGPREPKNMSYLLKIVKPQIGVLLNVELVHTEQFLQVLPPAERDRKDRILALIAAEKGKIVTSLSPRAVAIVNGDSSYFKPLIAKIKAQLLTFGSAGNVDFRLTGHSCDLKGTVFEFIHQSAKYTLHLKNQHLFPAYGETIAAVVATAWTLGIPVNTSIDRLEKMFHLPPGRFSTLAGKKNSTILDSSYNSSPKALQAAIQLVGRLKVKGAKIAVLGDMRELGDLACREHQKIATLIQDHFEWAILIGPLLKQYTYPELIQLGFPQDKILVFKTAEGVGEVILTQILKNQDLVLVKGSQNTLYLETVVKSLLHKPESAQDNLCRQTDDWEKLRQRFFKAHPNNR